MYGMRKQQTMVDPPSGWKYGFPAPLDGTLENTLKKHNYPENLWDIAREYSRYWVEYEKV